MNIEIANRLVRLRKEKGYSQEELAEKLGLSRQAISKWERAEASPDTDNLILLSRLYGISLDELLFTEDEIPTPEPEKSNSEEADRETDEGKRSKESTVHIGWDGVHVQDGDDTVHVGWDGIHVDSSDNEHVHIGADGFRVQDGVDGVVIENGKVFVNGEEKKITKKTFWHFFPWTTVACIAYLLCGFFDLFGGWGVTWILFLIAPLLSSLVKAIEKRSLQKFSYPLLCLVAFFVLGFYCQLWHPGWAVFLTIPIWYGILKAFRRAKKSRYEVRGHIVIDDDDDDDLETEED
ncbi:MAG: helix-turn-helix domain-containing protein [Oscillospiraceae bacterium]|nr:helix-turn-helix domain-containing protein [Oscillospiraceae bacterium]